MPPLLFESHSLGATSTRPKRGVKQLCTLSRRWSCSSRECLWCRRRAPSTRPPRSHRLSSAVATLTRVMFNAPTEVFDARTRSARRAPPAMGDATAAAVDQLFERFSGSAAREAAPADSAQVMGRRGRSHCPAPPPPGPTCRHRPLQRSLVFNAPSEMIDPRLHSPQLWHRSRCSESNVSQLTGSALPRTAPRQGAAAAAPSAHTHRVSTAVATPSPPALQPRWATTPTRSPSTTPTWL